MRRDSILIHGLKPLEVDAIPIVPPLHVSAVFEFGDKIAYSDRGTEIKYSREENPTVRYLEKILSKLEYGVDALTFNSGMAAITTALISYLKRSVKVLIPMEIYGSTMQFLFELSNKFDFKVITAYPETDEIINKIISEKPNIVFIESMTNPMLRLFDVREISKVCREVGSILIVDNTLLTPLILNPIRLGANLVIHSLSKYIAGHNDAIAGAVISSNKDIIKNIWSIRKLMGSILNPFTAYLTLRGIKTLSLRLEKASKSALIIAEFLKDHPKVSEVFYPGLRGSPYKELADKLFNLRLYGALVSFKVKGGKEFALKVLSKVRIIRPSTSFGGTESLITSPTLSASKYIPEEFKKRLGLTPNLLRLSVGLEDPNDLIEDLDRALM